jgi:hypothetical protein
MALINEAQDSVWEDLGVSKEEGRPAVEMIEHCFPDDSELVSLRADFAQASDAAFWQGLEDRHPSELETKANMPRHVLMDFFVACCCKMGALEVKQRLRAHIAETGDYPTPVVHEVLGEVLELVGFEREHGQRCCREQTTAEFENDREVINSQAKWDQTIDRECIMLLNQYRKDGGALRVNKVVAAKLREVQAQEELDTMSPEERGELVQKNAKKVDVFRKLPPEGRQRYLEKLTEEETLELTKSEILMVTILQHQHQKSVEARIRQSQNVD